MRQYMPNVDPGTVEMNYGHNSISGANIEYDELPNPVRRIERPFCVSELCERRSRNNLEPGSHRRLGGPMQSPEIDQSAAGNYVHRGRARKKYSILR